MSFKWIKDAICEWITPNLQVGRADDNDQITFSYSQEKGKTKEYAVIIKILLPKKINLNTTQSNTNP